MDDPPPCRCKSPGHQPPCPGAALEEIRRALFAGLFDDGDLAVPALMPSAVRLLDPEYCGDDPASRRFALLETE